MKLSLIPSTHLHVRETPIMLAETASNNGLLVDSLTAFDYMAVLC